MTNNLFGFDGFYDKDLKDSDNEIYSIIEKEAERQGEGIELIASENIVSRAVIQAMGSVLTNKYAEGYPGKRYYGGCEEVDKIEQIAIDRVKKMYGCEYANVQPHSGSQANQGVFNALLKPGDTIMGLDLACGGHLTHGAKVNQSGKWFRAVSYTVDDNCIIDMDSVRKVAHEEKPQLIIAGGSAYSREWDFAEFRKIADEIGAYFLVDMAHFAGLVAAGLHSNPFPHAHVATSTTHKTIRGPRGGIILTNDADLAKKFNSAIFPGIQGGPLMHVIASKAVAFGEALKPEFKVYQQAVLDNANAMADAIVAGGLNIVSGGTDNHLFLVDLRAKGVTGNIVEEALGRAEITCNKNGIPFDPEKPMVTSGIRLGSPAGTSRGFGTAEFKLIGEMIVEIIDGLAANGVEGNADVEASVKERVNALCAKFPLYPELY